MYRYLTHIKAALPYESPGTEARYLKINLDLDRLTILVGPNASGKTAILEAIGYTISGSLEPTYCALGLALVTTLRPRRYIPSPVVGTATLDGSHTVSNLYIELTHLLLLKIEDRLTEIIHFALNIRANTLLQEVEKDVNNNANDISKLLELRKSELELKFRKLELKDEISRLLFQLLSLSHLYRELTKLTERELVTRLISNIVGQDVVIAEDYSPHRSLAFKVQEEVTKYVLPYRPVKKIKILYSMTELNLIDKAFIMEHMLGITIVKRRCERVIEYPRVVVFHPGFVYRRGLFERLYQAYVYEGLPNEKASISILKKYIEFIDGYELIGKRLHVRTVNGKRISVYNLSDGYRVAVFMGLLYAISKPPVLFLIDTPEAFVHPDGLPVIADLIARLVAENNQVVVATQSIEFLGELLVKAREYGIIDYTSVKRVELARDGTVKVRGSWIGEVALESIRELGADLRR